MKKFMLGLLILAAPAFGDGPRFSHKDKFIKQEFENVYHDIANAETNLDPLDISSGTITDFIAVRSTTTNLNSSNAILTNATITNAVVSVSTITSLHVGSLTGVSFGKVKQVVSARSNSSTSSTSGTYVDTNLSVEITPSASTSKILILASGLLSMTSAGENGAATLVRGSTDLSGSASGFCNNLSGAGSIRAHCTAVYLDSPSTTSATTYKVQIRRTGSSGSVGWGDNSVDTTITCLEIGA